ncbi:MAG: hypothetical protein KDK65_01870 [Chlamydiia bacterium]|nr:hypothetical protein [Chlamydiia bacterium]
MRVHAKISPQFVEPKRTWGGAASDWLKGVRFMLFWSAQDFERMKKGEVRKLSYWVINWWVSERKFLALTKDGRLSKRQAQTLSTKRQRLLERRKLYSQKERPALIRHLAFKQILALAQKQEGGIDYSKLSNTQKLSYLGLVLSLDSRAKGFEDYMQTALTKEEWYGMWRRLVKLEAQIPEEVQKLREYMLKQRPKGVEEAIPEDHRVWDSFLQTEGAFADAVCKKLDALKPQERQEILDANECPETLRAHLLCYHDHDRVSDEQLIDIYTHVSPEGQRAFAFGKRTELQQKMLAKEAAKEESPPKLVRHVVQQFHSLTQPTTLPMGWVERMPENCEEWVVSLLLRVKLADVYETLVEKYPEAFSNHVKGLKEVKLRELLKDPLVEKKRLIAHLTPQLKAECWDAIVLVDSDTVEPANLDPVLKGRPRLAQRELEELMKSDDGWTLLKRYPKFLAAQGWEAVFNACSDKKKLVKELQNEELQNNGQTTFLKENWKKMIPHLETCQGALCTHIINELKTVKELELGTLNHLCRLIDSVNHPFVEAVKHLVTKGKGEGYIYQDALFHYQTKCNYNAEAIKNVVKNLPWVKKDKAFWQALPGGSWVTLLNDKDEKVLEEVLSLIKDCWGVNHNTLAKQELSSRGANRLMELTEAPLSQENLKKGIQYANDGPLKLKKATVVAYLSKLDRPDLWHYALQDILPKDYSLFDEYLKTCPEDCFLTIFKRYEYKGTDEVIKNRYLVYLARTDSGKDFWDKLDKPVTMKALGAVYDQAASDTSKLIIAKLIRKNWNKPFAEDVSASAKWNTIIKWHLKVGIEELKQQAKDTHYNYVNQCGYINTKPHIGRSKDIRNYWNKEYEDFKNNKIRFDCNDSEQVADKGAFEGSLKTLTDNITFWEK